MKKTVSALALLCIILMSLGWWELSSTQIETSQFVDLEGIDSDSYYSDPLQDFDGTVVFAFHDSQAGMDEENLKEYLEDKAIETSKVVKIDVNSQRTLAQRYNVRTTPTLFVMQDGQIVSRDQPTPEPLRAYSSVSHQRRATPTQARPSTPKPHPYGNSNRGYRIGH